MDSLDDSDRELELPAFSSSLADFKYVSTTSTSRTITKTEPTRKSARLASGSGSSAKRKRIDVVKETLAKKETTSPPKKRKIQKRGYATPDTYAHLPAQLPDHIQLGLNVVFCGINPGCESARSGHHFAHPTNHFWKCLHESGMTPERIPPSEDASLPERFSIGLTNLVERPSAEQSELSQTEQVAGVDPLLIKILTYRPRIVCFVGIGIAKPVFSRLHKLTRVSGSLSAIAPGIQRYKLVYDDANADDKGATSETLFFVVPSTSGRVTQFQLPDKIKFFAILKQLLSDIAPESGSTAVASSFAGAKDLHAVLSSSLKLEALPAMMTTTRAPNATVPMPPSAKWLDELDVKMETIKQEEEMV